MQIKIKIVRSHTTDSKPVKQEVNGTVILPPLVFPALAYLPQTSVTKIDVSYVLKFTGWFTLQHIYVRVGWILSSYNPIVQLS